MNIFVSWSYIWEAKGCKWNHSSCWQQQDPVWLLQWDVCWWLTFHNRLSVSERHMRSFVSTVSDELSFGTSRWGDLLTQLPSVPWLSVQSKSKDWLFLVFAFAQPCRTETRRGGPHIALKYMLVWKCGRSGPFLVLFFMNSDKISQRMYSWGFIWRFWYLYQSLSILTVFMLLVQSYQAQDRHLSIWLCPWTSVNVL